MAILNNSNAISTSGFSIDNSLRFRKSASAYLNRTPASASNRKTWTWSAWLKRGTIDSSTVVYSLFGCTTGATDSTFLRVLFYTDKIVVGNNSAFFLQSTQLFRDPSAWYHIVVATDTNQGTASNRMRVYINGIEITAWGTDQRATYLTSSVDLGINQATQHSIGSSLPNAGEYFDGYMTDINFVDGSQLTPSSFGETDADTGSWKPKKYTGTYGTNGFYLKGRGTDNSGNGNNWTENNFNTSNSALTTYDIMTDVPMLTSATVANYPTWNPLFIQAGGTTSNANLTYTGLGASGSGTYTSIGATMAVPTTGKWYWEIKVTQAGGAVGDWWYHGIMLTTTTSAASAGAAGAITHGDAQNTTNTAIYNETVSVRSNQTDLLLVTGDTVQVAYDAGAAKLWFGRNNQWYDATTGFTGNPANGTNPTIATVPSGTWVPYMGGHTDQSSGDANFGQRPFTYTPPTGFVRLNTYNLPDSTIKKGNTVMDATLFTATAGSNVIVNAGAFKPDLVWLKARSNAQDHYVVDSVRGGSSLLRANTTAAENTIAVWINSFNSNGFTTDTATLVTNPYTYAGWQWQAGQGTTSSNTSGTITSTVSVNATAGFSVVTYTGSGAAGTVGHGLGVAPAMIITKNRTTAGNSWVTWQKAMPNALSATTAYMYLDQTAAAGTTTNFYDGTAMTSSTFRWQTGNINVNSTSNNYVSYCWAEIAGFSKFTSYVGNNSADGPFVYCGFRPKFVMIKDAGANGAWVILDSNRATYNVAAPYLQPSASSAEVTAYNQLDFLSNGFKLRADNANSGQNNLNGYTYIVMAFAENPFKNANAR